MLFISNKQLIPTYANLRLVLMYAIHGFSNQVQTGHQSCGISPGLVHVKTIAVLITHLHSAILQ